MMIFTSIYGVVDGLFVSNFAGKTAFAAINLVMPFIMVLGGIGFMIGTGGTALVSKTLGEGRQAEANRYFSMMILFTALLGVILSVVGVVFMRPVALFLGATPEMLDDCVRYGRIVTVFTGAFMLQNVFQSSLIAAEKPKLVRAVPKNELGFICLSGLATGGSWLCYYKALQDGPASVVAPIDKLSILVTILFSWLVFHEKLTKKSALGLAAVVGGTLLMLV